MVHFQELVLNFPIVLMACWLDMRTVVTTGMRLTAEVWVQVRGGLCGMYSGQGLKGTGSSPSNPVLPLVLFPPLFFFIPLPPAEQSMDSLGVTVPHIHIHVTMITIKYLHLRVVGWVSGAAIVNLWAWLSRFRVPTAVSHLSILVHFLTGHGAPPPHLF